MSLRNRLEIRKAEIPPSLKSPLKKILRRSLLLRKLQYLKSPLSGTNCFNKYNFLGINEIFSITYGTNLDCQM